MYYLSQPYTCPFDRTWYNPYKIWESCLFYFNQLKICVMFLYKNDVYHNWHTVLINSILFQRAAVKMANMDSMLDDMFTSPKDANGVSTISGISICGILTLVSSSVLFLYLHVYIYQCVVFFRNLYWSLPTFCSSLISARGREVSVSTCCGEPRGTPRDSEWPWKVLVTSNWKTFLQDLLKCLSLIMVGNIQYKTVYSWKYKNLCNVLLYTDTQQNKIFVWTSSLSS